MKKVRTTSAAALRELTPSLSRREQIVLDALADWRGDPPSAYELTRALQERGLVFDLNGVRPRISALVDKGLVTTGAKRRCRITGRTAFTWRLAAPPVPREPEAQRLEF